MKAIKTSKKGKVLKPKVLAILLLLPATALPIIALIMPKRSNIFSVVVAIMPLISFLCIYFILRRTARHAGKSVQAFMQEHTERPSGSALVLQQVLGCSELAVLTTIYTDVVLLKKSRMGLSKSYSIYRYVGRIKTGIQLDCCEFDIDTENQTIALKLPSPQIFDHSIDIDDIEKFDEKSSLFCKISNSELFAEISRQKEEAQQRLVEHGLLDATLSRAKLEVTQLLSAAGYLGYDINIETLPAAPSGILQADSLQTSVHCLD